jgi:hypothetical protein
MTLLLRSEQVAAPRDQEQFVPGTTDVLWLGFALISKSVCHFKMTDTLIVLSALE